jgi:hypothetical protein
MQRFALWTALASVLVFCGCSRPATEAPAAQRQVSGSVSVKYKLAREPVSTAVYIEDAEGRYVRSLYLFVPIWRHPDGLDGTFLEGWMEASREARAAEKKVEDVDAITHASPVSQNKVSHHRWNLRDWRGERVHPGRYTVRVTCDGPVETVSWEAEITLGHGPMIARGRPDRELPPDSEFRYLNDMHVVYRPDAD